MDRRQLLQLSAISGFALLTANRHLPVAARMPEAPASPIAQPPYDEPPLDTRARELVARLHDLSPLVVLEALETADVSEPILLDVAGDDIPIALPWYDMSDMDLEHALGGVVIAANGASLSSQDLAMLGNYIVLESAEIAYDKLMRQMEELQASMLSTTAAGTMVWIIDEEDMQIGVMRLGNVLVSAITNVLTDDMYVNVPEGMIMHLDTVTRAMV